MDNKISLRNSYVGVFLIAFALAVGTYIYFATDQKIYVSRGKFSYYFTSASPTDNLPFTSEAMTKSIADSIQTRTFLEDLYQAAGIQISEQISKNPDKYIKTSIIENSSVIQVSIFNPSQDTLNRLGQQFYKVLEKSPMISGTNPPPKINIIDSLYISKDPAYPKPLEYSALAFIGPLLVAIMLLYIFYNEN